MTRPGDSLGVADVLAAANAVKLTVRVEHVDHAGRCRGFTARGRQCKRETKRVVIYESGFRSRDCGLHDH